MNYFISLPFAYLTTIIPFLYGINSDSNYVKGMCYSLLFGLTITLLFNIKANLNYLSYTNDYEPLDAVKNCLLSFCSTLLIQVLGSFLTAFLFLLPTPSTYILMNIIYICMTLCTFKGIFVDLVNDDEYKLF